MKKHEDDMAIIHMIVINLHEREIQNGRSISLKLGAT